MIHKAYKEYSYSKRDLNPHSRNGHGILSPACLPIPPFEHPRRERAENETRTRDPNLGKVMLYQLSYFRKYPPSVFNYFSAVSRLRMQR